MSIIRLGIILTAGAGLQATFSCVFQSISWPPTYEQHLFIHDKGSLYFLRLTDLSIHKQLQKQASSKNHFLPSRGISRHSNDVMCKQPIVDRTRMEGVIIVILCALYCNVFSPVNETWGNLTVLNSVLSQCRVSCRCLSSGLPVHVHVFWRRRGLGDWFAGRVRSYAFKASLLLLAPQKSATLPLTGRLHDTGFNKKKN